MLKRLEDSKKFKIRYQEVKALIECIVLVTLRENLNLVHIEKEEDMLKKNKTGMSNRNKTIR